MPDLTWPMNSAEVIKIEHPTRGDDTRAWGPPYAKYREGSSAQGPGESAYFIGVGRVLTVMSIYLISYIGKPKQKVTWSILPAQGRCRYSSQACGKMRRLGRKLPSRDTQEV